MKPTTQNYYRNEKKIIFLESENFIINLLKINGFKEIHKERIVNSIYFDDYKFSKLIETVDGEKNRSKLRLRWYGEINDIRIKANLEEKIKVNTKNYKIHHQIILNNIKDKIEVTKIRKEIINQLNRDELTSFKIKNTFPSSFVSYKRRYYLKNGLRITVDKDLVFKNFFRDKYLSKKENFEPKKFFIVEFKFDDDKYNIVRNISSQLLNRFTKFSKYEYSLIN